MKFFVKIISTFFGMGYSPIASGTAGSALAAAIIWFFLPTQSYWYIAGIIIIIPLAAPFCGVGEKFWHKEDARKIVLDEAVGMAITYAYIQKDWRLFLAGFFLFRLYDIVKIPPAGAAEKIKGGWGVLLDDVVVGIYANIGLWIIKYFAKL
ncbi:phosphatidylglycerophosphatase A [bacterium]|nr:phosphatidylglycerophosphatase A [bacterium]